MRPCSFTTLGLTVVFDLVIAVEVGMVLAAILFNKRVSDTTEVSRVTEEDVLETPEPLAGGKEIPPGVIVCRIFGPFLFGAAEKNGGCAGEHWRVSTGADLAPASGHGDGCDGAQRAGEHRRTDERLRRRHCAQRHPSSASGNAAQGRVHRRDWAKKFLCTFR